MEKSPSESPLEIAEIQLRNNLKMLAHLEKQTNGIMDLTNGRRWQRHKVNLEMKLDKAHALITNMVELKIEQNLEEQVINKWVHQQENSLEQYKRALGELEQKLTETECEMAARKEQEKQLQLLDKKDNRRAYQRKLVEELELKHQERLRMEQQTAKLPKLQMTKFKGTLFRLVSFLGTV